MRVLIVAANQEHKPDPVVPLGAAYIAGAARAAGHEVRLVDACFEGAEFAGRLAQELTSFNPRVVGISLRNIDDIAWPRPKSYLPWYRTLVKAVRENAGGAVLVLGGSAFTLMPEAFMHECRPDFGIAGAGEEAFSSLLGSISPGHVKPTVPELITATPLNKTSVRPALDLLDLGRYYERGGAINVQTKRGCPFQCSYCTYPLLEGSGVWSRDLGDTVGDMEQIQALSGVNHFFVVDNTFNTPETHARAFCEEILRRELHVQWTAYVTPRGLTRELCELMARAGCTSAELGTDAASVPTLRGLGKGFGPPEIVTACDALRAASIRFSHSLILGGPGETPRTLTETAAVIAATRADFVVAMLGVRVYPRTHIARELELAGELREADIGLEPVFYVAPAVKDSLIPFAEDAARRHGWYFPGLEGGRWLNYWRRLRRHGARGPLWTLRVAVNDRP